MPSPNSNASQFTGVDWNSHCQWTVGRRTFPFQAIATWMSFQLGVSNVLSQYAVFRFSTCIIIDHTLPADLLVFAALRWSACPKSCGGAQRQIASSRNALSVSWSSHDDAPTALQFAISNHQASLAHRLVDLQHFFLKTGEAGSLLEVCNAPALCLRRSHVDRQHYFEDSKTKMKAAEVVSNEATPRSIQVSCPDSPNTALS